MIESKEEFIKTVDPDNIESVTEKALEAHPESEGWEASAPRAEKVAGGKIRITISFIKNEIKKEVAKQM